MRIFKFPSKKGGDSSLELDAMDDLVESGDSMPLETDDPMEILDYIEDTMSQIAEAITTLRASLGGEDGDVDEGEDEEYYEE